MSFNITRGNLDQHLVGPANPAAVGQVITVEGNHKFTVHGAPAGSVLGPLPMNIPFAHSYGINQTQMGGGKGGVTFGFCDEHGNAIGVQGHDQAMSQVTTAQAGVTPLYWQAKFLKSGDYTFGGGAG